MNTLKPSFWCRYLLLTLKRTLKKPFVLFLLLLFPFITWGFTRTSVAEKGLYVGIYTDDTTGFSHDLAEKIVGRDGIFHFYITDSVETLNRDVASGYAECGYIIPDTLIQTLNEGRKRNLIDVITSHTTTMSKITNEIVYSELFEEYSFYILERYLTKESPLEDLSTDEIESLYRTYLVNGSTFAFDITGAYTDYTSISEGISGHAVTGIIAILVLLGTFSGLFQYSEDEKNMLYSSLSRKQKNVAAWIQILCPFLLFFVAGGISLSLSGYFTGLSALIRYLLYGLLVLALCLLLFPLVRVRMLLLCILPMYLIGCLVFTPIFIDISLYLPDLEWISRIFITHYLL